MICQICGKHNASMLVRQIVGGKTKELYLCRACAKKHHIYSDDKEMSLSLKAIFDGLVPKLDARLRDAAQQCQRKKSDRLPSLFFLFSRYRIKVYAGSFRRDLLRWKFAVATGDIFGRGSLVATS